MEHYIITRFNLKWRGDRFSDPVWIKERSDLMKNTLIKTLNNQSDKNFKLILLIDRGTSRAAELSISKACKFPVIFKRCDSVRDLKRKDVFEDIAKEGDILSRVDSDDIISPKYIENIKSFFKNNIKKNIVFDYKHIGYLDVRSQESIKYRYSPTSMFISILYYNNVNPYSFSHDLFRQNGFLAHKEDVLDCCCIVHGGNLANNMRNKKGAVNAPEILGWIR